MAVVKMLRVSICALKKDRKAILEQLQSYGVLEIQDILKEDDTFVRMDTAGARATFEKNALAADSALEILDTYDPVKSSMFASMSGKQLIGEEKYQDLIKLRESTLDLVRHLISLNKQIAEGKANIQKLNAQIESLVPWLNLDVPMNTEGTKETRLLIGTLPGAWSLEDVYSAVAELAADVEAFDVQILYTEKDMTYLTILCRTASASQLESALRLKGFSRLTQTIRLTPLEQTEKLKQEVKDLQDGIEQMKAEIVTHSAKREELRIAADYYQMRADKYEVLGTLPQSEKTFIISGYVPERVISSLREKLESSYTLMIDVEEISEEEDYPVMLENNPFSASFDGVVESYGLPQRKEFDPTTIMSFFYVFFFGLMLSDACYGAILAIACFAIVKKYPRMSPGLKKNLKLFMYCGISTLIWGILFGGYFGDLVDVVSNTFFGKTVTIPALWFVPLNEPMKMLMFSLLFGTIHLFTGLAIKGYITLKDKAYMDFFCDVFLWFLLLIGLLIMLLPSSIFASISQMEIVLPDMVNTIGKWAAILGAAGIVLLNGRSSKNPVVRILLGAYDLYNVTGWLSDVLSYSRLLALGLATGVIAQVMNLMGSMLGTGIIGIIAFVIIFIVGHTFNIAINLLGAYVHTNRLQFVEFFGKFYEGGGRPFHPFKANTKYVDFKEDSLS